MQNPKKKKRKDPNAKYTGKSAKKQEDAGMVSKDPEERAEQDKAAVKI
jgi:hypothetical protein